MGVRQCRGRRYRSTDRGGGVCPRAVRFGFRRHGFGCRSCHAGQRFRLVAAIADRRLGRRGQCGHRTAQRRHAQYQSEHQPGDHQLEGRSRSDGAALSTSTSRARRPRRSTAYSARRRRRSPAPSTPRARCCWSIRTASRSPRAASSIPARSRPRRSTSRIPTSSPAITSSPAMAARRPSLIAAASMCRMAASPHCSAVR